MFSKLICIVDIIFFLGEFLFLEFFKWSKTDLAFFFFKKSDTSVETSVEVSDLSSVIFNNHDAWCTNNWHENKSKNTVFTLV